jgi:Fur family transcriptional regulator, stress-responsive regulator
MGTSQEALLSGPPGSGLDRDNAARLRAAGLRVTRPRLAVMEALTTRSHADADTVSRLARRRLGSLSTQAVYDILGALVDARLIRRIEPAGSPARYETRVGDNHHHIVCRVCGWTVDVDCAVGETPCLDPSETRGFVLDEAEVTFWGLCPDCRSRLHSDPDTATGGTDRPPSD